ncbi:phosphoribosylanthranilate isomerase [Salegentibacter echinorum]|uniref:N-(5'-phosphoribosyl)anthranilate isomerase n=2 Tax=Salegentibacter echinorum TaxID=1073325 RepID=A0A1M5L0U7_SALEC|nr:phosphoribosylanthranilate isomerase [Salegentibacter echinorum]
MKEADNILEVAELQPDYMGFIFYDKTPRNFDAEMPQIPSAVKKTGVFVNAKIDDILKKIRKYDLKALQLHGNESPEFCGELNILLREVKIELIKVFSIGEDFDFKDIKAYEAVVDYFLFDTKGKNKGGNGTVFNWEILKEYPSEKPFFLSGGIGLEQLSAVKELQEHFRAKGKEDVLYAIDVNSKFEDKPGLKNVGKLKKLEVRG